MELDAFIKSALAAHPQLADSDVKRFLLASKGNQKQARQKLDANMEWRAKAKPEKIVQLLFFQKKSFETI